MQEQEQEQEEEKEEEEDEEAGSHSRRHPQPLGRVSVGFTTSSPTGQPLAPTGQPLAPALKRSARGCLSRSTHGIIGESASDKAVSCALTFMVIVVARGVYGVVSVAASLCP